MRKEFGKCFPKKKILITNKLFKKKLLFSSKKESRFPMQLKKDHPHSED